MQGLFCTSPGIIDKTHNSSGFLAKGTLISVATVPHIEKNGEMIQEKKYVECTGKIEISMVGFLAACKICTATF